MDIAKVGKTVQKTLVNKGMYILGGILLLIIAHIIGNAIKKYIYSKGVEDIKDFRTVNKNTRSNVNQIEQIKKTKLVYIIIGQTVYYVILSVAVLILLKILGIEATSIIAIVGAAGFTIGLALQGTFTDIASGILLGIFQTYTIGDLIEIEGGSFGRVKDFNLTRTILNDLDTNALIIVPNRKIAESTITNHSKSQQRRIKFQMNVSNSYSDFEPLIQTLTTEIAKIPGVLRVPSEPVVGVENMGEVGTVLTARLFIKNEDFPGLVLPIQSRVRQILADMKVPMVDPF